MEGIAARKHKPEVQQQLRNQAIHLRKKGWKYAAISDAVGVHANTVAKWCGAYKKGGITAVRIEKRGRKEGMKRTLGPEQEAEIQRLIKDSGRKVFLILDNLWVHHSIAVKEWLENHRDEIEVFFLPSYSPDLNPDEYLNCDLKIGVHSGLPARNSSQLKAKAISHLRICYINFPEE